MAVDMQILVTPVELGHAAVSMLSVGHELADISSEVNGVGVAVSSVVGLTEAVRAVQEWSYHHIEAFGAVIDLADQLGRSLGAASEAYLYTDAHVMPGITPTVQR
ncbi:MAG: hypothetical protein ACYDHP_10680 [Ferrimicrobium sp.]